MDNLYDRLEAYCHTDYYPYHMPGHKRNGSGDRMQDIWGIDITEIDGFDNLHEAQGILWEAQQRAARVYGAEESFFLINGSTGGILSAVSAALPEGGHLLMARNCHKSVYHAVYLRGLRTTFLYPSIHEQYLIDQGISAAQVEAALQTDPSIQAVMITSPSYEGVVSDVAAIAEVAHAYGIPLIVDEAHGAHFGMQEQLPVNSCEAKADLVIHSLHKTLPSLTQTALLHRNGTLIDAGRLQRFLRIYQSSSPSYVFMASIDRTVAQMETQGSALFERFLNRKTMLMKRLSQLQKVQILTEEDMPAEGRKMLDPCKLVISVKNTKMTGMQLYDKLLYQFHLQMEMAAGSYVLAILTIADTEEGFTRLGDALLAIDLELQENSEVMIEKAKPTVPQFISAISAKSLQEAWNMPTEAVPLETCAGRIAGEFLYLYPPGIPLVVPGEILQEAMITKIKEYENQGLSVKGLIKIGNNRKKQEGRLCCLCVKQKSFVQ